MPAVRRTRRGGKELWLGLLVCVLAFSLGCSADDIMGPSSGSLLAEEVGSGSSDGGNFAILADPLGGIEQCADDAVAEGSGLIRAEEGGVVSLGRFRLEIPAGALSEDTFIEISRPDPHLVMCELEPHGIQFNLPVTLQIDYGGTTVEDCEESIPALGVYWFDEVSGDWQLVGDELDTVGDKIEAQLGHFSKYASGWGS